MTTDDRVKERDKARADLRAFERACEIATELDDLERMVRAKREQRDRAVRDLRERGFTLQEIASAVGVTHPQVANIIRGDRGGRAARPTTAPKEG